MRLSKILIVPLFLTLAAPQVVSAGERVDFSLRKGELTTPEKRELLLDRMTTVAARSCENGSLFATRDSIRECAADLRAQLLRSIDDDALTLLAKTREQETYRSANR